MLFLFYILSHVGTRTIRFIKYSRGPLIKKCRREYEVLLCTDIGLLSVIFRLGFNFKQTNLSLVKIN